jgi:predicted peptidase
MKSVVNISLTMIISLSLYVCACTSNSSITKVTKAKLDDYQARVYTSSYGDTIPYRLFIPRDYDSDNIYPLVLFHHGAGGRGADNKGQFEGPLPWEWAGPERQAKNPCFIVAPQTPDDEPEVETVESLLEETEKMWEHIQTIQEILNSLEDEFSIDVKREYVTGLSMGGGATWMSLLKRPDRFAAAAPVCAGDGFIRKEKSEIGQKFAQFPLWIFHGDADKIISVEVSRGIVKSL